MSLRFGQRVSEWLSQAGWVTKDLEGQARNFVITAGFFQVNILLKFNISTQTVHK